MLNRFTKYNQLGEFANPESGDAYFFFPHAVEKGILDVDQLDPNSPQDAALRVRNAQMPTQAGTVFLGNKEIAAYDLVSGKFSDGRFVIGPSHKDNVNTLTREIEDEGFLTLSSADGSLIKVIAEITNSKKAEWSNKYSRVGELAVKFFGLEAPTLEVVDMRNDCTVARPRSSIFSFPSLIK